MVPDVTKMLEELHLTTDVGYKMTLSAVTLLLFFLLRFFAYSVLNRKVQEHQKIFLYRRVLSYIITLSCIFVVASIWLEGIKSITTFLGLVSAGVAIAMHDTISNLAAWVFLMSRKPFKVGDRIEIDGFKGDVVDARLFQFTLVEIGNWVDAEQSTGRLIHIPNNLILKSPLVNYHGGFEFIWHEIPVLITFESDWKKAKELLQKLADDSASQYAEGIEAQIKKSSKEYLIFSGKTTPIVWLDVKDSGVLLTIRYLVNPRRRRGTTQNIWEQILELFEEHNIELAYPTQRFVK